METITVQAVYAKGVLRPRKKLNLAENSVVDVLVMPATTGKKKTLFGAIPSLNLITEEDFTRAKQEWERGVNKQIRILKKKK